jgi:hypothetical protein
MTMQLTRRTHAARPARSHDRTRAAVADAALVAFGLAPAGSIATCGVRFRPTSNLEQVLRGPDAQLSAGTRHAYLIGNMFGVVNESANPYLPERALRWMQARIGHEPAASSHTSGAVAEAVDRALAPSNPRVNILTAGLLGKVCIGLMGYGAAVGAYGAYEGARLATGHHRSGAERVGADAALIGTGLAPTAALSVLGLKLRPSPELQQALAADGSTLGERVGRTIRIGSLWAFPSDSQTPMMPERFLRRTIREIAHEPADGPRTSPGVADALHAALREDNPTVHVFTDIGPVGKIAAVIAGAGLLTAGFGAYDLTRTHDS